MIMNKTVDMIFKISQGLMNPQDSLNVSQWWHVYLFILNFWEVKTSPWNDLTSILLFFWQWCKIVRAVFLAGGSSTGVHTDRERLCAENMIEY